MPAMSKSSTATAEVVSRRVRRRVMRFLGRPVVSGVAVGSAFFLVALLSMMGLHTTARQVLKHTLDQNLIDLTLVAASHVDAETVAQLDSPALQNGPAYVDAVAPWRRIIAEVRDIKYIYTVYDSPEGIRFGLDAALPIDANGDGISDQAGLGELYKDPDSALLRALESGEAAVSPEPYTDRWGTFMSAFVPLRQRDGTMKCLVGVDVDVADYQRRLAAMSRAAWMGASVAALGSVAVGFGAFLIQRSRRRSDEALNASSERLARIAENLPGMIYQYRQRPDGTGGFDYASPAIERIYGVTSESVAEDASAIIARIHPDDINFVVETSMASAARLEPWHAEYRVVLNHSTIWVAGNAVTQRESDGTTVWHGYVTDVTARRRADDELRQARDAAEAANRAKSEFLANMSHEIRTPMTAIMGFAALLRDDPDLASDPVRRREAIETIDRNAQHLLTIINDILDLSKIEAGRMTVERIATDPWQVIEDVLLLLAPRARAKEIELRAERADPLPAAISSDPVRLRQVVMNLVANAVKFTDRGSVVVRATWSGPEDGSARNERGSLRIAVEDTGIGMEPSRLARLFAPFSQADGTTTRRFGGTGLGLAISRRLIQILGGNLEVTSELGRGSAFTIVLPAEGRIAATVPIPTHRSSPGARLLGVRILIAEDGSDLRRLLTLLLEREGATTFSVEHGRAVLECFDGSGEEPVPGGVSSPLADLVIMDMQMPGLDGYDATKRLRQRGCTIPIIALTAHAMAGDRERCLSAGCDDYITKPVDEAVLLAACERLVRVRGSAH